MEKVAEASPELEAFYRFMADIVPHYLRLNRNDKKYVVVVGEKLFHELSNYIREMDRSGEETDLQVTGPATINGVICRPSADVPPMFYGLALTDIAFPR